MDMKQIALALGIETYPECFDALYRQVAEDKTPACDMVLIAQAQEKYEAFGEYYDTVCSGAEQINADPVCSTWVRVVKTYLEKEMGPIADVPVVDMNGTPKQDMLMLACQIPLLPAAAERYRKGGFSEEQIAGYMRSYGYCLRSTELRTGYLGLNATYFRWLNHFVKAEIFRVNGVQFEFTTFKRDVVFLRDRQTGDIVPVMTAGMIHASGKKPLGTAGYTDGEGAYEAVFTEDDEKYEGYGVYDSVVSREWNTFSKSRWECILRKGDKCLSIHLPRGADISDESINKACREAYAVIEKGFPEYIGAQIHGSSWILDPDLETFLGANSKIVRFGKWFVRYPNKGTGRAADSFVFPGKYESDGDLPENTSLQRALKQHYLNGGYTYGYSGILIR